MSRIVFTVHSFFFQVLRPLRTNYVFHDERMTVKFDMRGYSSLLTTFLCKQACPQLPTLEVTSEGKERSCQERVESYLKDKTVASRACWKSLGKGKKVASQARWKLQVPEKEKSVASRACWKLLEKDRSRQERVGSYFRMKREKGVAVKSVLEVMSKWKEHL